MNKNKNKSIYNSAFTIVELLVVIVVIGILAAITIVSYSGISNKAIAVTLQSDLSSSAKVLKMYNVEHGYYPDSINANYCPDAPDIDNRYCLKASNGNELSYIGGDQAFILTNTNTNSQIAYQINEEGQVLAVDSEPASNVLTWKQVASSGNMSSCGVASDNNAYCWGGNYVGDLGNAWGLIVNVPKAVYGEGLLNGLTIKSLVSGNDHSCVIASDSNAYCWGNNANGNLGNNSTSNSQYPVAVYKSGVLNGLTVKSIFTGLEQSCIIASDDNAYCWGINTYGQLGNGLTVKSSVPVMVNKTGAMSGLTIKLLAIGEEHACAIASDNNAYCWGANYSGQLGNNSTTNSTTPVAVVKTGALNGLTLKSIYSQNDHTCVIASDDNAYCWGSNSNGELGDNSSTESRVPVAVTKTGALSGLTIKMITTGWLHSCAIASDNNAYCWGYNNTYGVLGNGSNVDSFVPVAVDRSGVLNGLSLKSISSGRDHVCVIANNNKTYCWGDNYFGQLGNGTNTASMSPVVVNDVTP